MSVVLRSQKPGVRAEGKRLMHCIISLQKTSRKVGKHSAKFVTSCTFAYLHNSCRTLLSLGQDLEHLGIESYLECVCACVHTMQSHPKRSNPIIKVWSPRLTIYSWMEQKIFSYRVSSDIITLLCYRKASTPTSLGKRHLLRYSLYV